MRTKGLVSTKTWLFPAALLWLALIAGCGEDAPPYADLPLRDVLNASPEVLASLPEQALHDVALRLEEAHVATAEQTARASSDIPTVSALVRSADAQREDNGNDAIVLGALDPAPDGFLLRSLAVSDSAGAIAGELSLRGLPAESTAGVENAALRGRAGVILTELGKQSEAREIVRVTGLPAGVVALNQKIYVNGSWLVALSALEPPPALAPPAPAAIEPPAQQPLSVRINPYNLPPSIAECAFDVREVCSCAAGGLCDHKPTDPSFANGQEECEWVRQDPARAEALCILALMSIDAIRECVHSAAAQCNKLPIGSRDEALAFVTDAACMDVMEVCLDGGEPVPSSSSSSGSSACNNSCSGCDSCNNDVSQCNQSCSKCNDNCADCNQNCKDCTQNSKDCNENQKNCGKNSVQSNQCRSGAGPRPGDLSALPLPLGTLFWVFGPAGYILRRIRRRS